MTAALKTEIPLTPAPAPLDMPAQVLSQRPNLHSATGRKPSTWLVRLITFGGALALTALAGWQMYLILPFGEVAAASASPAPLLWLLLSLFTLTFGWICLSATAAVAGLLPQNRGYALPDAPLKGRTVLLMPFYNEDANSSCAALAAMGEDLSRLGLAEHFDIFIVSDTNTKALLPAEMAAVHWLRGRLPGIMPVWYRRREQNTDRKAGNIREFISQWGNSYDYMVVLDADSLIAGDTLATLVREMDADPATGLLQTLPRLHGSQTLFARLQQFSATAYGCVFARGLSAWQGHDGNYWGHNAIIRIRAFAECAGLPNLRGPSPFGGEIRSHDFVEAALIRRAGWGVRMMPELQGSWEECPPTLLDAAIRDRRWAQGNIQHLAVVATRGLRWPSRAHMLMGVMNYLTSLFWLAMVTLSVVLSTQFVLQQDDSSLNAVTPMLDAERMLGLFMLTAVLLLLPKLIGVAGGLVSRQRRGGLGRRKFVVSAVLELVFSVLHAPIFMVIHSRHLWEIACGQDSGWSAQQRRGVAHNWRRLLARHGVQTVIGLFLTGLLLWLSLPLLYWMLPLTLGLMLAIPLSALSGSRAAGCWLAKFGVLATKEELAPHSVIVQRQSYSQTIEVETDEYQGSTVSKPSGEISHLYETYDEKRP